MVCYKNVCDYIKLCPDPVQAEFSAFSLPDKHIQYCYTMNNYDQKQWDRQNSFVIKGSGTEVSYITSTCKISLFLKFDIEFCPWYRVITKYACIYFVSEV